MDNLDMTDPSSGSWQPSGSNLGQELSSRIEEIFRRPPGSRPCRMPPLDNTTFSGLTGKSVKFSQRGFSDSASVSSYPQAMGRMSRMEAHAASGYSSPRSMLTPGWLVEMDESIQKARSALRRQPSTRDLDSQEQHSAVMSASAFERLWNMKYSDRELDSESGSAAAAAAAASSGYGKGKEQGKDAQASGSKTSGVTINVKRPRRIPQIHQLTLSRLRARRRTIPIPMDNPPPGTSSWQNPMYDTRRHHSAPRSVEPNSLDDKKKVFITRPKTGEASSRSSAKEALHKTPGALITSSTRGAPLKKVGDSRTPSSAEEASRKKSIDSVVSSGQGAIRKKSYNSVAQAPAQVARPRKLAEQPSRPSIEEAAQRKSLNARARSSVPETSQKKLLTAMTHSSLPETSQKKSMNAAARTSHQKSPLKKRLSGMAQSSLPETSRKRSMSIVDPKQKKVLDALMQLAYAETNKEKSASAGFRSPAIEPSQRKALDDLASASLEFRRRKMEESRAQPPVHEAKQKTSDESVTPLSIQDTKGKKSTESSVTSYSLRRLRRRRSNDSCSQAAPQLTAYKKPVKAVPGPSGHDDMLKTSLDSLAQLSMEETSGKKSHDSTSLISSRTSGMELMHLRSDESVAYPSIKETRPKKLDASFPSPFKQRAARKSPTVIAETSLQDIKQKSRESFSRRSRSKAKPGKSDDSIVCPPVIKKSVDSMIDSRLSEVDLKKSVDSSARPSAKTGRKKESSAKNSKKTGGKKRSPDRATRTPHRRARRKKSYDSMGTLSLLSLDDISLRSWDSLTGMQVKEATVGRGVILTRSPSSQRSQYGIRINTPQVDPEYPLLCFKQFNSDCTRFQMRYMLESSIGCHLRTLDIVPGYESADKQYATRSSYGHVVWIFSVENKDYVEQLLKTGVHISNQLLPVRYFDDKVKSECEANYLLKQIQDDLHRTAAAEACERRKRRRVPNPPSAAAPRPKGRRGKTKSGKTSKDA